MTTAIAISGFTPAQIRIIKQTVASDTNDTEFNLFMQACQSYGLDPFRKQIFAVVYSKDKPDKRKMSIIVSRDGQRVIAQRCKDYRPASEPAQVVYDKELTGLTNPKGIVSATVRLWKQDNRGEWYPVIGEAYWDEFAPVSDEWAFNEETRTRKPTGKKTLDASGQWAKMPIVMLTKCAESQALRAGWPDQFGNVYSEEEMDRFATDVSATETLEKLDQAERQERVGGPGLMMVFDDTAVLSKIPMGQVYDECTKFLRTATAEEAYTFGIRNAAALKDFWAYSKSDALELKKQIEAKSAPMIAGAV